MGYFRILYYISYIFNTITRILKRHGKFVLWFFAIFIFLFFTMYSTRSHAIMKDEDITNSMFSTYDSMCIDFLERYEQLDESTQAIYKNYIVNNATSYSYYIYYGDAYGTSMYDNGTYDYNNLNIIFYPRNSSSYTVAYAPSQFKWMGLTSQQVLLLQGSFTYYRISATYQYSSGSVGVVRLPSELMHYNSDYIYNYFFNNYSLQELELMYQMKTSVDNVENTINQTNEFLNEEPSDEDFSGEDLPSDSGVTDTTEEYTNTIFSEFYNTITGNYVDLVHAIDITIPFTNKHIKISGNYTKQYLPTALKDLISMFWYFAISILIYRDLMHKFNKIRSGDIEHVQDNNIKEDML